MKSNLIKTSLLFLIRGYQRFLSPIFPPSCRYYPSCSNYALEVIEKKGVMRGSVKAMIRILKCNPFFPGGYDPVE